LFGSGIDTERLIDLILGIRLDQSDGVEFVSQDTFRSSPELYRQAFTHWRKSQRNVMREAGRDNRPSD